MRCVDGDGHAERFHGLNAQHVHDEIVISKTDAALAKEGWVVRRDFTDLGDDVLHIPGREELRLFHVEPPARRLNGFGADDDEIGLTRKKGWHLNNLGDFRDRYSLINLVIVGDDRHAELGFHFREDFEALFHARPAIGCDGRPVRLVEAGLENIGQAEPLTDGFQVCTNRKGELFGLQDIQPGHHDQRMTFADGNPVLIE